MKKLILTIIILLFAWPCWGATVYTKNIAGTVYYDNAASSCDDVTAGDTSGDLEAAAAAAGADGTLYICAGTYTETDLDADSQLHISESGQTIEGIGTVIIDTNGVGATCLVSGGYDNLTIKNIDFRNATLAMVYLTQGSTNIDIENCIFTGDQGGDGIYGMSKLNLDLTDITIQSCNFHDMNDKGIRFRMDGVDADNYTALCHTFLIDDCTFTDITGNGIYFEHEEYATALTDVREFYGATITDNTFTNVTGFAIGGIFADTAANLVSGNTATNIGSNNPINAFQFGHCRGLTIEDNTIVGVTSHVGGDGHGIILDYHADVGDAAACDGVIVRRNYVSGAQSAGNSAGIKVYRGKNSQIYNNVFTDNKMGISLSGAASTDNVYYNNTLFLNTDRGISAGDSYPGGTFTNNIIDSNGDYGFYFAVGTTRGTDTYNCVYGHTTENYFDDDEVGNVFVPGAGTITVDPKLVSATDYHLLVSSPCIDAGADLTATVLTDIDGQDANGANMDGDADGAVTDMDIGADQVLFLSVLTGAATTLQYSLLDGEDGNYAGLAFSTGHTIDNVTIARCKSGAFRVNGNQTVNNMAIDDECYIATGATLTVNNSAFQEAEVTATGDGTMTDTSCLFSQTDFGFRVKASGDFRLTAASVLKNAGADTGAGVDLDGKTTPIGSDHDIGAYEFSSSNGSTGMGMGLRGYSPSVRRR